MTLQEFYEGLRWMVVLVMIVMLVCLVMAIPDEGLFNPPEFSTDMFSLLIEEGK